MDKLASFMDSWYGRFIRSAISLVISAVISKYQNQPLYLSLSPVLQSSSKFVRDTWPNKIWEMIPF